MNKYILWDNHCQQINQNEEIIYEYLFSLVKTHSPEKVIAQFHYLFIEGECDESPRVYSALRNIVISPKSEEKFHLILDRCCQMMINHWCQQPATYPAILALVSLFNNCRSSKMLASSSPRYKQLWLYNHNYTKTKLYLQLKRLARTLVPHYLINNQNPKILGDLLYRYTFLYKHSLLNQDGYTEYSQTISYLKSKRRNDFELALIKYLSYRTRLIQIARARQFAQGAGKILPRTCNPTLLNEIEFNLALKSFRFKAEKINFDTIQPLSCQEFKDRLYQYLIDNLFNFNLYENNFKELLFQKIQSLINDHNSHLLTELILLNICSQIIDFLLLEESPTNDYCILSQLVNNLGATHTVHLFLKIIILCPKVKPHLDKRLSYLFERYELFSISKIGWLIKFLENLLMAYSTCLGKLNLSIFMGEFLKE